MRHEFLHGFKWVTFVLGLILIATGCSTRLNEPTVSPIPTVQPAPASTGISNPTATQVQPSSTTAAVAPIQQSATEPNILYRDDFTDPNSGWPNKIVFDNYYIGYHEPSYYHVEVHVPHDRAVVAVPKRTFDDFTVETKVFVETPSTAPTGDFRYGLVLRRSGNQYYAFTISPRTKTWYVLKSSPTGLEELKKGNDDSIQGLEGLKTADTLRVDAKGSLFFLHINDHTVGQFSDLDYAGGEVGFYVETFDSPRAHIHYHLITIRQVDAPQVACTVTASSLNLWDGPSTQDQIDNLVRGGTHLIPFARSSDGSWIKVRVEGSDLLGWVPVSKDVISCQVQVNDLPVLIP